MIKDNLTDFYALRIFTMSNFNIIYLLNTIL